MPTKKRKIANKRKIKKITLRKTAKVKKTAKVRALRKTGKSAAARKRIRIAAQKPKRTAEIQAAPITVVEVIETETYSEEVPAEPVLEAEPE